MRLVVLLACALGACGFEIDLDRAAPSDAPGATGDASETDAPITDASIDAAPTWTVVETILVDTANPQAEVSTTVLAAGVTYRLRVSGTIDTVIDSHQGDADWFDFNNPKDLGCCEDLGLGIDDLVVNDQITLPNWGPYSPTHVYQANWVGAGRSITALYQDTYYGNNQGTLTLEILALQ